MEQNVWNVLLVLYRLSMISDAVFYIFLSRDVREKLYEDFVAKVSYCRIKNDNK